MQPDTIVRIYSMSKVITSVAVLQLFEEGRFALDEPVTRFIPELRNLKVCTGGTVENPTLAEAKKPITIKHLLTHTAGFAYDFSAKEPVRQLYLKADLLEAPSLKEFIQRLARLPLVQQPGEAFNYGVNTDVLGYLVEVVSGQPLEDYLRDHISEGFGLGGSVRIDLARGNALGSVGQFGWSGAATTAFNIDPKEKTVALLITQHLPNNQHGIVAKFYTLFYQSLVD